MIRWYRRCALAWLPRRAGPWAQRMSLQPGGLDVRDLGYRWGSLGKSGHLNIHWAAMQLPASLLDYVIVHELAHIGQPRHTRLLGRRRTRHARLREPQDPSCHDWHYPLAWLTYGNSQVVLALVTRVRP